MPQMLTVNCQLYRFLCNRHGKMLMTWMIEQGQGTGDWTVCCQTENGQMSCPLTVFSCLSCRLDQCFMPRLMSRFSGHPPATMSSKEDNLSSTPDLEGELRLLSCTVSCLRDIVPRHYFISFLVVPSLMRMMFIPRLVPLLLFPSRS